jgi:hypothetical protein
MTPIMRMLFPIGIALFLATGTAHAVCSTVYETANQSDVNWWWGTPIMCANISMSEERAYGICPCLRRYEMPLPRRRPKKASKSYF